MEKKIRENDSQREVRYNEAVGRRKTAIARVRIKPAATLSFTVNGEPLEKYFPTDVLRATALQALTAVQLPQKVSVSARVYGGGIAAQSEALRHGVARAVSLWQPELRKILKAAKFLTRDPRMKERRKFGLKKARRAPQWSKR